MISREKQHRQKEEKKTLETEIIENRLPEEGYKIQAGRPENYSILTRIKKHLLSQLW